MKIQHEGDRTVNLTGLLKEYDVEKIRSRNLTDNERIASMAGGGTLLAFGLIRRDWLGLALAAAGGALAYFGATGSCGFLEALGIRSAADVRPDLDRKFGNHSRDIVEERSWESFPASDPP